MRFAKALLPLAFALVAASAVRAAPAATERFAALGLQPVGGKSYLVPVRRVAQTLIEGRSKASLSGIAGAQPLVVGRDLVLDLSAPAPGRVEAPMVFVGYGLMTPAAGYDDFTGRDLKGAVLVAVEGAPEGLSEAGAARASTPPSRPAVMRSRRRRPWPFSPARTQPWPTTMWRSRRASPPAPTARRPSSPSPPS